MFPFLALGAELECVTPALSRALRAAEQRRVYEGWGTMAEAAELEHGAGAFAQALYSHEALHEEKLAQRQMQAPVRPYTLSHSDDSKLKIHMGLVV